jgi:hypothetical protein
MKTWLALILTFLFDLSFAQTGGRKREGKNQNVKVLKMQRSPWAYKPTKPGPFQKREQKWLFRRSTTRGGNRRDKFLDRQNRTRAKHRIRGNAVFYKRKY